MSLATLARQTERFVRSNSPVILTAVSVAGTITTAILAARAHHEAMKEIDAENFERRRQAEIHTQLETPAEKFKHVWKCYIPPVISGVVTIGAIVGVNQVGSRRTAAIAAAYSILENTLDEYKEKVVEKLGANKETALRDEIAQDRINRNPVSQNEVIITGGGDVLCYDAYTDRYFMSSVEKIRKAENEVNFQLLHGDYASLADFYLSLGIPPTLVAEEVGWNAERLVEVVLSTCMSDDDRPCISVSFSIAPNPAYRRFP